MIIVLIINYCFDVDSDYDSDFDFDSDYDFDFDSDYGSPLLCHYRIPIINPVMAPQGGPLVYTAVG
jgi:hypothetical protein